MKETINIDMVQYELDVTMTAKEARKILEERAAKYADHYPMTVLGWLSEISSIDLVERMPWAVPYTCLDDPSTGSFNYWGILGILEGAESFADSHIVFRRTNTEESDDWVLTSIDLPANMAIIGNRGH